MYALSLVQGEELPCSCSVLFSTQEETGERGATIGAFTIEPDIALAVDVTFALGHGDDPVKCGKMGGGPMIGISPTLSRDVTNALIAAADAEQIPWQPEVMSGMTGTNADRFSVTKGGVRTELYPFRSGICTRRQRSSRSLMSSRPANCWRLI